MIRVLRLTGFFLVALMLVSACGDGGGGGVVSFEEFETDFNAFEQAERDIRSLGYRINSDGTLDSSGVRATATTEQKREKLQALSNEIDKWINKYDGATKIKKDDKEMSIDEALKAGGSPMTWANLEGLLKKFKDGIDAEIRSL